MGTHTNDDSVFREFQRSLKQKQPDFLFAHFIVIIYASSVFLFIAFVISPTSKLTYSKVQIDVF